MLTQIQAKVPGVQPIAVNTPYFQEPFLNLYYEAGGNLLTLDLFKAAIHNEKALQVLKFYQLLYAKRMVDLNDKTPWDSLQRKTEGSHGLHEMFFRSRQHTQGQSGHVAANRAVLQSQAYKQMSYRNIFLIGTSLQLK